jgi:hypothetical protein
VCDLHPEFGYVGSASVRRKLGFVLAFLVVGLVAGASGLAVFMANFDRNPKHAMALAPAEALFEMQSSISTGTTETEVLEATLTEKTSNVAETKPPCREDIRVGNCPTGKKRKPRSTLGNERPAIAAVPIGRRVDPTVLPPEPAVAVPEGAVTATPAEASPAAPASLPENAVTASPSDTPSAESTPPASLPAAAPTKARERYRERAQRHQREHREYASMSRHYRDRNYDSTPRYSSRRQNYRPGGGYAVLW